MIQVAHFPHQHSLPYINTDAREGLKVGTEEKSKFSRAAVEVHQVLVGGVTIDHLTVAT